VKTSIRAPIVASALLATLLSGCTGRMGDPPPCFDGEPCGAEPAADGDADADLPEPDAAPDAPSPCPRGETLCGDAGCINTSNSAAHCGACWNACAGCDRCIMAECTPACCAEQFNCGTPAVLFCVDLRSDPAHCGGCDSPCTDGTTCRSGACVP
jgi:hypothetical protein